MKDHPDRHIPFVRIELRAHDMVKRILLVGCSLVSAYFIAYLTSMIQWMTFWIRGPHAVAYQVIFLVALFLFLLWWLSRYHNGRPLPLVSTLCFSVVAGYGAGLLAVTLYPILQEDGWHQVVMSLQFPAPEAAIALFWFPVRLLTWLFGGLAGGLLVVMSRRTTPLSLEW